MAAHRYSLSRTASHSTQSPLESSSHLSPSSDSVARAVLHFLPPLMSPAAVSQDTDPVSMPSDVDQTTDEDIFPTNTSKGVRRASVAFPAILPEAARKMTRSHGAASDRADPNDEGLAEYPSAEVAIPVAQRRILQKVSRACDFCKQRKARCTGTLPCDKCTKKGLSCQYNSSYSRGRPPTPPPSMSTITTAEEATGTQRPNDPVPIADRMQPQYAPVKYDSTVHLLAQCHQPNDEQPISHASPELAMEEIEGQVFDPTSGVTFMHRAWKRLSKGGADHSTSPGALTAQPRVENQPLMLAGDLPLPAVSDNDVAKLVLPPLHDAKALLALYFETCIVTYRILHPPSLESWLAIATQNIREGRVVYHQLGRARTSILLSVLAIATAHDEKKLPTFTQTADEAASVARSDYLYCISHKLTEDERGPPLLESAQARVIQVLYLLLSSRMNRAWYTFGNALQIISVLGLHRKAQEKGATTTTPDYRQTQLRIRTFWAVYILDKYLGVILGRPRHYHDEDIDQVYPDRVEDEDMGPHRGTDADGQDCHVDGLICHAKIARIVGATSREVYSINPITQQERCMSAHRLSKQLHEWRANLPPHLGTIRPSMLIQSFRRQSQVLQLAYCHAIMHANRLFLLGSSSSGSQAQGMECVDAAQTVLEAVDRMAREGPWIQAFWWTQYVAFHGLVITYVWDIQRRRWGLATGNQAKHEGLMALAERCQAHLAHATASNSPSRRYAVILEEFRSEALGHETRPLPPSEANGVDQSHNHLSLSNGLDLSGSGQHQPLEMEDGGTFGSSLLDDWQTTDWLDLDSSAFGLYMDVDPSPYQWMPDLELS